MNNYPFNNNNDDRDEVSDADYDADLSSDAGSEESYLGSFESGSTYSVTHFMPINEDDTDSNTEEEEEEEEECPCTHHAAHHPVPPSVSAIGHIILEVAQAMLGGNSPLANALLAIAMQNPTGNSNLLINTPDTESDESSLSGSETDISISQENTDEESAPSPTSSNGLSSGTTSFSPEQEGEVEYYYSSDDQAPTPTSSSLFFSDEEDSLPLPTLEIGATPLLYIL